MKKLLIVLALLVPFFLPAQQVARQLTAANGQSIAFWEYKPTTYNAATKYPLLIFLHGIGERGDGTLGTINNVAGVAIPHYIRDGMTTMTFTVNGVTSTFLVLSPQLSFNYGEWPTFYVDEMLNYARNNLSVDWNRVYLTGLSLGGGGVWRYATSSAAAAKTFAAIVPVCGTPGYSNLCNLTNNSVAVWAFHALDDGVVGVYATQNAIATLNNCSPQTIPAKATYYPTGNHYIWDKAYDLTHNVQSPLNVFEWMLTQTRGASIPPPPPSSTPPVSVPGSNQTITLPTNSVWVSGSGSYAPSGGIAAYNWTQVSGPNTATIASPTSAGTTISNLIAGTYTMKLTVTDYTGATGSNTLTITVNGSGGGTGGSGSGTAPVADAGADQTLNLPTNSTFLTGSGSYVQGGGTISSYNWSKVSGPNNPTISSISTTNVQVSGMVAGTYVFRLTVTNSTGTSTDDVVVTVNGTATTAPVANAGSTQTITIPTNSATLNGSASSGSNLTYQWTEVSGPSTVTINGATSVTATVNNLVAGTYSFQLVVKDNNGATSTSTTQVVVNGGVTVTSGNPAVALAGADVSTTASSVFLYGSSSYSQGGGYITSYNWTQVSGPNQASITAISSSNVQVANLITGTYTFKLSVTNNYGNSSTDEINVIVNGGGSTGGGSGTSTSSTLFANAGADQSIVLPSNQVFLMGSGSYTKSGWITNYQWSQVSGPNTATLATVSSTNVLASNLVSGTYTFRLKVTDNAGGTSTDDMIVTVTGTVVVAGNNPPVAVTSSDQWLTLPTNIAYLAGSGSYDPGGTITNWQWSQVSGPNNATIRSISSTNVEASNLIAGIYTFKLTVTDNNGASSSATMKVTVNGSGYSSSPNTTVIEAGTTASTSLSVYPNPAISTTTVEFSNTYTGTFRINFIDQSGVIVKTVTATKTATSFKQTIDISGLIAGTYVVETAFGDGTRLTSTILKQ